MTKKVIQYMVLTSVAVGLSFASCAEDDEIIIPHYTLKPKDSLSLDENPRGDEAFESYNKAYLVTKDGLQFYRDHLSTDEKAYYWGQALSIQMAQDVYWRTKSNSHATLIKNLLNAFIAQNKGSDPDHEWAWNDFNDDVLWAGLAFARGYQVTNEEVFLDKARYAFDMVYDRGWDDALGGGIWWRQTPINADETSKSALSNSPAIVLGCYLYEFTGEEAFKAKVLAIADWTMNTLFRPTDGGVYENIKASGVYSDFGNVYSNGTFVEAMAYLHKLTGESKYYDAAVKASDYVKEFRTTSGIMSRGWRDGTWQSEFLRGIGNLVRENNNLWSVYYDWLRQNANAAWNTRRTDLGLTWNNWLEPTEIDNKMTSLETVGGVIIQQLPVSNPELLENRAYSLVYREDTTKVLEMDQATIKMVERSEGFSNMQRIQIVFKGHGFYQIKAESTAQVLALDANSLVLEPATDSDTQLWKLVFDNRNCFKLKPKSAPLTTLKFDGAKLVIGKEKHDDSERWLFKQ